MDEIFSPSTVVVGRRRRRSSPSSVISTFSSKGGTFEKNQIFAVFQKLAIFLKSKIFSKMSGRDFFAVDSHRRSSPSSVVAVVGRRRRPSFPFFVQGRDLWKKSDFRCFSKKLTIFLKSKIFSKMSGRDFIAVDSHRRSSPSSVVAVVGRRRHPSFPLFRPREGPLKKIRFSLFFKNLQFFWNPRFLAKWVDEILSPSTVVVGRRRRRSSPSSVISTFSSKGGTFEKNQIFAVFQKLAIFLKSKIFSKMSGRDFFAVDGRRRSSPSSVVAVVRHFHFFVQGRDLWKKSDFRCFSKKLTIFLKSKIFSKMSGRDFIAVDGRRFYRRRRSSSVVAVVAVIRHFHFFVQGRDLWKKSDFRCFSKTHNFSEIQDF